jgi:hypothetical protein
MANRTATLYIRITTADGKRRYCKAAYQSKGRLKPQYAMVNGEPERHKMVSTTSASVRMAATHIDDHWARLSPLK